MVENTELEDALERANYYEHEADKSKRNYSRLHKLYRMSENAAAYAQVLAHLLINDLADESYDAEAEFHQLKADYYYLKLDVNEKVWDQAFADFLRIRESGGSWMPSQLTLPEEPVFKGGVI